MNTRPTVPAQDDDDFVTDDDDTFTDYNTDDDGLPMPRGVSARNNYQDSDNFNSARDDFESSSHVEYNVSSGSENYKTTYDRS